MGRNIQCPGCSQKYVLLAEMVIPGDSESQESLPSPTCTTPPKKQAEPVAATKAAAPASKSYDLDEPVAKHPEPAPMPKPAYCANEDIERGETGGLTLPLPALIGGAVAVALISVLGAWLVLRGGNSAPADATTTAKANVTPAPAARVVAVATPPAMAPAPQAPSPAKEPKQAVRQPAPAPEPAERVTQQPVPTPATSGAAPEVADAAVAPANNTPDPEHETDFGAKTRANVLTQGAADDGTGKQLTTAEIVAESEPSVALVTGKLSSGTGFLVAPGLVATNSHVIDDEFISDLTIRFVSSDKQRNAPLRGELLYEDPVRDLAFIAVKTDLKPLRIAKSYTFKKGEDITVIGNPGTGDGQVLENAISRGVMSTKAKLDNRDFYQINIAINPGNSGGPVFDSTGRVIGVATLKSMKQESSGFSIPIEDLQSALVKLSKQRASDAEKYRSQHRMLNAVKALGTGGALMCLIIDVRRAAATNPNAKDVLANLERAAGVLDKELFPSLESQAPRIKKDAMVPTSLRSKLGEMSDNFSRLHSAYLGRQSMDANQLWQCKQIHRQLITEVWGSLKLEIPKDMMVAFDDHISSQQTIVTFSPQNMGSYSSRLRQRSLGTAPGIARPPGSIINRPSARDRLKSRGIR